MAAVDMTAYAAALKRYYPYPKIQNMTYRDNVAYAMMPKNTDVGGDNWTVAVQYEDLPSRSATFSVAQANKGASKKKNFLMTSVDDYSLASIKGKVWRASQGSLKALMPVTVSETDSAFNAMRRSCGIALYRDGTGHIGTISSGTDVTSTTLTLSIRSDIHNFGVGQKIVLSAAGGSAGDALRDSGASIEISSINRRAGSMVLKSAINTITGAAVSDFIYIEGDAADGGTNKRVSGFETWLPQTAPTSGDSHFGVDRSDDSRLYGQAVDATGMTVEEALIEAQTECAEYGMPPDCAFIPFLQWKQLGLELGTKKEYRDEKVAGVGFRGYVLQGNDGEMVVYADRNCPGGKGFVLRKETWKCESIGPMPGILDLDDAGKFLREATDDAYEMRVGGYPQVSCNLPAANSLIYNWPTSNS